MTFLYPDTIKYSRSGVAEKQVSDLRSKYGGNSFRAKPKQSFLSKYLGSFADPIIKILLIALALNLVIAIRNSEIYEPLGIAIALFLATFVSTVSEYAGERAFAKLQKQQSGTLCRVIRDGKVKTLAAKEIVAGDVLMLSAGERVPADCVIFEGSVLVDQSALSGESDEVRKSAAKPCHEWSITDPAQLFSGSVITSGECVCAVGRTGDNSLYGQIAGEIQQDSDKSPLTKRLTVLASALSKIGYVAAALVFFADLFNSLVLDNAFDTACVMAELSSFTQMTTNILHALTLAITVVVVAVPEGLPMMITVVLSSNMSRLKRDNVLVRKLVGIETCGCVNILFCDKTGTLTCGRLTVTALYGKDGSDVRSTDADIANCMLLSNESAVVNKQAVGGNATDRALLNYAIAHRLTKNAAEQKIPFNSRDKFAAAKYRKEWYVKGAPEVVLAKCSGVDSAVKNKLTELTTKGIRVLALAKSQDMKTFSFVGLVAVSDKLRPDVRRSVATVKNAGIQVCMVTGDNFDTACEIARSCGVLGSGGAAITSEQMSRMSDSELKELLPRLCVVARALPTDKSRLVRIAKSLGLVCAMTGDGINDAPALRQADVGFAMGSGTEVAKEAGDIVIADDNLSSISKAILQGRTIFKSIRKFIVFQLTMNLCAVGISIIGPFIGIDTPVTVMQMLWINIIMDTLAGLAFAGEPPLERYMREKPISRSEKVLSLRMGAAIFVMGGYNLLLCTLFLTLDFFRSRFGFYTDNVRFMTAFFALFVFSGVFGCLIARSGRRNLFAGITGNKNFIVIFTLIVTVTLWLIYNGGQMFRTVPLPVSDLAYVIALAFSCVPVFEVIPLVIWDRV